MNDERAKAILEYWFGDDQKWWKKDPEVDRHLREAFGADLEKARAGELNVWTAHPESCLALVLLLDQFSRHVHRDTAEAFASDTKAQATVLVSISRGMDRDLSPIQRAFFYMPLMHAEDPALQERSVDLFSALADEVPERDRRQFESFHEYAVRHREIIDRFGRFPHRNQLLGRDSTPEELAFLEQPGSRF